MTKGVAHEKATPAAALAASLRTHDLASDLARQNFTNGPFRDRRNCVCLLSLVLRLTRPPTRARVADVC